MEREKRVRLPNDVEVRMYGNEGKLGAMTEIVTGTDFIEETETMKRVSRFPPMSILMYDDFMALGFHEDRVVVGMNEYKESHFLEWVDRALSLGKHPVRVIGKTSDEAETLKRLEPRTKLDWIEYDPASKVLKEIDGAPCPAKKYLESLPASNELYSVLEYMGRVLVVRMKIDRNLETGVIQCHSVDGEKSYALPIEQVENIIRNESPGVPIVREPLKFCNVSDDKKPWACLAHIFETTYADKNGISYTLPTKLFTRGGYHTS
jgi:hypothetical protein